MGEANFLILSEEEAAVGVKVEEAERVAVVVPKAEVTGPQSQ